MPEQILDGPQIRPGFQQVRREGMPQRIDTLLINSVLRGSHTGSTHFSTSKFR